MNTKIVILIPIVVAIISAYTFWSNRPAANPDRDGRSLAQPVLTLKKANQTVEIYIWGKHQYFTVKDESGKILAEMLNLDELTAKLPDTAKEIGRGLADISAENSTRQTPINLGQPGQVGNVESDFKFRSFRTEEVPKSSLPPLPDLQKEPSEESGVSSR